MRRDPGPRMRGPAGGGIRQPEDEARQYGVTMASLPPSPRLPRLAQTLAWTFAPTWLMDACARRLGEAFTITFWPSGMKMVLVSAPAAVKEVFGAPPELAPSGAGGSPLAPVMGPNSVLVLTGPAHLRQRRLLLPPFHGERMREYEDVIVEATRSDMASWPLGVPTPLLPRTRAITLEVILRAVFGVEGQTMLELKGAIDALMAPTHSLRLLRFALRRPSLERPGGPIGLALDRLDALIYAELARRRADRAHPPGADILSLLMAARDEEGREMSDEELRDELVTLLLAGHETTATTVAWALERLVRTPRALARLTEELDADAGSGSGSDSGSGSGSDSGSGEAYLTAVVNETLRVRPVVPLVVRALTGPMRVDGWELPAGTRVAPCIYLVNRNERVYEQPAEFRPERFLGEGPETFAWIPFGGGIRRCIGASFAQLEARVILRTVLASLHPSAPPGRAGSRDEGVRRRAVTLIPARGARIVWQRRGAVPVAA